MRILVDAMGGDNAPDQIALGAIQAAKDFGCEVVLVGRGEAVLRALKDQGIETLPKGVEIANADDVVDMHDDPATVVKKKKDSSMVVGLNMLKEGGLLVFEHGKDNDFSSHERFVEHRSYGSVNFSLFR